MAVHLTNREWFALFTGFLSGLRIQNAERPDFVESNTILYPKPAGSEWSGVSGLGGAGTYEPGALYVDVPIYASIVNVKATGFSITFEYNTFYLQLTDILPGEFGTVGVPGSSAEVQYTDRAGVVNIRGKKDPVDGVIPTFENQSVILCYMRFSRRDPTVDRQYNMPIKTTTPTDLNATTLFWEQRQGGSSSYLFISPLNNQKEIIVSTIYYPKPTIPQIKEPTEPKTPIGNPSPTATTKLNPGAYFNRAWCSPGRSNSISYNIVNPEDTSYKYIRIRATIQDTLRALKLVYTEGISYWSVGIEDTVAQDGTHTIEIIGECRKPSSKLSSTAVLYFEIDSTGLGYDTYEIRPELVEFSDQPFQFGEDPTGGIEYGAGGAGYIYEKGEATQPTTGNGKDLAIVITTLDGEKLDGENVKRIPVNSVQGEGVIWSSKEMDVIMSFGDNNQQVIHLYPGPNKVKFWIPVIKGPIDKDLEEYQLKIQQTEKEGYTLIEGGFSWDIIPTAEDNQAVQKLIKFNRDLADGFQIYDFCEYDLTHPTEPVNLDELIEEFQIVDFTKIEKQTITQNSQEFIEDLTIEDVNAQVLEIPIEGGEFKRTDSFDMIDEVIQTIQRVTIKPQGEPEGLGFEDFMVYEIEKGDNT